MRWFQAIYLCRAARRVEQLHHFLSAYLSAAQAEAILSRILKQTQDKPTLERDQVVECGVSRWVVADDMHRERPACNGYSCQCREFLICRDMDRIASLGFDVMNDLLCCVVQFQEVAPVSVMRYIS